MGPAAWQRSQQKLVDSDSRDLRRIQQLLSHFGATHRWRSAALLLGNFARHRELQPDLQLFNSLINVYGKSSRWPGALNRFQRMGQQQLEPSRVTYNTVLSLDLNAAWPSAWRLLKKADLLGFNAALGRLGCAWHTAEATLRLMNHLQPDVVTYAAVMKCQQKAKRWQNAAKMLHEAARRHLRPTVLCWSVTPGPWQQAFGKVQLMRSRTLAASVVTLSAVITSLGSERWTAALQILDDAPRVEVVPNVISYNASICACASAWRKALELLRRIWKANLVTFNSAISAFSTAGEWQWALVLLKELESRSLRGDSFTVNAAISACETRWTEALELLRLAHAARLADVISYSSCISSLEKGLQWQKALDLFFLMPERSISPNLISCNAAISACEKCGVWQLALLLLAQSQTLRLQLDLISFNASLSACENASEWEHAVALLEKLGRRSLRATAMTYNVAMSACSHLSARWREVVMLQQEMRHLALDLNLITFNVALKSQRWPRCCGLYEEIAVRNLEADALTFQHLLRSMAAHLPGIPRVLADLKRTALLFHAQHCSR